MIKCLIIVVSFRPLMVYMRPIYAVVVADAVANAAIATISS